ncbi:MAG: hypothetical protein IPI73_04050 [Betaproteobacteria bacterium]|nr:hypothetical protein [Betaproteobacteria bacterium]
MLLMLATSVVSQISAADLFRRLDHPVADLPRLRGLHRHLRACTCRLTLLLRVGFGLCYHLFFRR